eukprot:Rhum_TRINITY_DN14426_c3_g2::Rhum_TRINITY_DN14426_c3_g2_i1::g.87167::m.87167
MVSGDGRRRRHRRRSLPQRVAQRGAAGRAQAPRHGDRRRDVPRGRRTAAEPARRRVRQRRRRLRGGRRRLGKGDTRGRRCPTQTSDALPRLRRQVAASAAGAAGRRRSRSGAHVGRGGAAGGRAGEGMRRERRAVSGAGHRRAVRSRAVNGVASSSAEAAAAAGRGGGGSAGTLRSLELRLQAFRHLPQPRVLVDKRRHLLVVPHALLLQLRLGHRCAALDARAAAASAAEAAAVRGGGTSGRRVVVQQVRKRGTRRHPSRLLDHVPLHVDDRNVLAAVVLVYHTRFRRRVLLVRQLAAAVQARQPLQRLGQALPAAVAAGACAGHRRSVRVVVVVTHRAGAAAAAAPPRVVLHACAHSVLRHADHAHDAAGGRVVRLRHKALTCAHHDAAVRPHHVGEVRAAVRIRRRHRRDGQLATCLAVRVGRGSGPVVVVVVVVSGRERGLPCAVADGRNRCFAAHPRIRRCGGGGGGGSSSLWGTRGTTHAGPLSGRQSLRLRLAVHARRACTRVHCAGREKSRGI